MGLVDKLLCFGLFGELIVTWNAMSYLTAIKDYKGILLSFSAALVVSFVVGFLLLIVGMPHIEALMIAVCVGYGSCFCGTWCFCTGIFHQVMPAHFYFCGG